MQVSVESTGNLERRVTLSLPAGDVDNQVGGRLREIARTVRIKGFRPGKVPTKVVEQRYGGQVRAEILDGLLRQGMDQAVRAISRRRPPTWLSTSPAGRLRVTRRSRLPVDSTETCMMR